MGLLGPLAVTLLSACFYSGTTVDAQTSFYIRDISLSIEPSADVARDTNVTVKCRAVVHSTDELALSRTYTIYKGSIKVYTKTTSSSEDLLYPLPEVRVSNTGEYKCKIDIEGKQMTSGVKKLTVTGLSTPFLYLNKYVFSEGEDATARCSAPGETGSFLFNFYEDNKEILEEQVNSNHVEAKLHLGNPGIHKIHCNYTVNPYTAHSIRSRESNNVTVSVREFSIMPVLEIFPRSMVYEGDPLDVSCSVSDSMNSSQGFALYLSEGTKLLSSGYNHVNHTMVALATTSGEFECKLDVGNVAKFAAKRVSVTELFSVPTLSMSPAEVFQGEDMVLTCWSETVALERLSRDELTYTLDPLESRVLANRDSGVFSGRTLPYAYNYTCIAEARGIMKRSKTLTVRPKVSVSHPRISTESRVILGRPFQIRCLSDRGSLPINYTLWKKYDWLNTTEVKTPYQKALFNVTIHKPEEIKDFMCEAQNNPRREGLLSKKLNATVIVPLSEPMLTVLPDVPDIAEGHELYLICGIKGTTPVTFKWYRTDNPQPLHTMTTNMVSMDFQVPSVGSQHSATYYCEAMNPANNVVRSQMVTIDVRMALWKKVVIGTSCLLVVFILVALCVVRFRSKRGKREAAAELSVKPSSPKSDDSLTVNLTPDTEVYKAATVKVNRAAASVWSEKPPNAATDEESSVVSHEPDVEYTEVVHPRSADPDRVPLRKGTETVYSELQNAPRGADDHHDYGSVEYADLNGEQLPMFQTRPAELPVPVD